MQNQNLFEREITFEIVEEIGAITEHSTGWRKELNLVAWNGGAPKYDLRDWDPAHEHMSRGITLTENEMRTIIRLLRSRGRKSGVNGEEEKQEEPPASAPAAASAKADKEKTAAEKF